MSPIAIYTSHELMFTELDAKSDSEVIETLAAAAVKAGYADNSFSPAVVAREKTAPTALDMSTPIAMPHVHIGCKKNFIAVATLKNEVPFGNMADLKNKLSVRIVFLIGIENLSIQSRVLRHVCNSFQISARLAEFISAKDREELLTKFKSNLDEHIIIE